MKNRLFLLLSVVGLICILSAAFCPTEICAYTYESVVDPAIFEKWESTEKYVPMKFEEANGTVVYLDEKKNPNIDVWDAVFDKKDYSGEIIVVRLFQLFHPKIYARVTIAFQYYIDGKVESFEYDPASNSYKRVDGIKPGIIKRLGNKARNGVFR